MTTPTPETATILSEMETPITLGRDEIEQQRTDYDLPDANHEETDSVFTDLEENTEDQIDEEDSQSEIPGDPREPHQLQPPTREAY